jgi:hypothetical protein
MKALALLAFLPMIFLSAPSYANCVRGTGIGAGCDHHEAEHHRAHEERRSWHNDDNHGYPRQYSREYHRD